MAGEESTKEFTVSGLAVSPGISAGELFVLADEEVPVPCRRISEAEVISEWERFENAISVTKEQLLSIQDRMASTVGEKDAGIFEAHLLVLEDATILAAVKKQLTLRLQNIEYVYQHIISQYAKALSEVEDPYLAERALDVLDVSKRVVSNLLNRNRSLSELINRPCIVVAHDLTPSDTAQLPREHVLGFATHLGSRTSHTAIIARSMNLPAIVGLDSTAKLHSGMFAVIDGYHGQLIVNPTAETLAKFQKEEERHEKIESELKKLHDTKAVTTDDRVIILSANIELLEDVQDCIDSGAEGIGLFRTEFIFANRQDLPDEEEQFQIYRRAAQSVKPHSVILRTLDLGGDKLFTSLHSSTITNPFLGVRAMRFCLAHPEIFRTQLRAMLRASTEDNVKIMYPMITTVDEVREANRYLKLEYDFLKKAGIPVPERIEVGIMIEVPAAALTASNLAEEVDFFSIGTNDLIQYTMACDRGNEQIAYLYEPAHPGVLRLVQMTIDAAHDAGIWVGVCGEAAGDIELVPLLVGMGVDELSVGAALVPRIKRVIRSLSYSETRELAREAHTQRSVKEVRRRLRNLAKEKFPELLEDLDLEV
jgi:phosphotransferase system enzyme I (PtsI)